MIYLRFRHGTIEHVSSNTHSMKCSSSSISEWSFSLIWFLEVPELTFSNNFWQILNEFAIFSFCSVRCSWFSISTKLNRDREFSKHNNSLISLFFLTHDVISCTLWFFGFDLELQEINFLVHSCICYKKADESILLLVYSLSCVMIRVSLNSKYRDNSQKWQLFGHFQLLCQEANQFHNLIWLETTKLLFLCMWQSLNSLNREKKIELNAEGVKYKLKVLEESTKWNFNVSIHFSQL